MHVTTTLLVTLPNIRRMQVGVEQVCDDVTAHGAHRRNSRTASCSDDDDLRRSLKSQDLSSNWQGIATSLCLSVCLSVGSSVSPRAYPIHGRPVACCSAQQSRRFQRAAAVFFGGGKKLRVAITFYSFALKSLKLLRPDVIS